MKEFLVLVILIAVTTEAFPTKKTTIQTHETVDAGNFDATIISQDASAGIINQTSDGDGNANIFETNDLFKSLSGNFAASNQFIGGNLNDVEQSDRGAIIESQNADNDKDKNKFVDNFGGPSVSGLNHLNFGVDNIGNVDATAKRTKGKNKIGQDRDNNWGSNYYGFNQ